MKPTLVLLPGFSGSGKLFAPLTTELSDAIDTVVLFYPFDRPLSYLDLCEYLLPQLPDRPFYLLGESFGGPLAMLLSQHLENRLRGIILCVTFAKNPRPFLGTIVRPFMSPSFFKVGTPEWYVKAFLIGGCKDQNLIDSIQHVNQLLTPEVMFKRLEEIADIDVTHIIQSCDLPILYLRGSKDRLVFKSSMQLVQRYAKQIETHTISGPHMLLQTFPHESAMQIKDFINKNDKH